MIDVSSTLGACSVPTCGHGYEALKDSLMNVVCCSHPTLEVRRRADLQQNRMQYLRATIRKPAWTME